MPNKKYLSKIIKNGNDIYVKDEEAQEVINALADSSDVANLPTPSGASDIETMQAMLDDAVEAVNGAEKVNCELFGSVVKITDRTGLKRSIDLQAATQEQVMIEVSSVAQGVSVSGLVINVYYNDSTSVSTTVTTDNNGLAVLNVPNSYKYRLVFPSIQGCSDIPPVTHIASMSQRSVSVEYVPYVQNVENVTIFMQEMTGNTAAALSGATVTVTVDGATTTYASDANGKIELDVPIGKSYTVVASTREGEYMQGGSYTRTFTAESTVRTMRFTYRAYDIGAFIISATGVEYALDEWIVALENEEVSNADAVFIKIITEDLAANSGVFYVLIDHLAERTYGENKAWASSGVLFTSIPENGNSASSAHYYDGKTASELIQTEGNDRSIETPAVDKCLALSQEFGGITYHGFLGSVGQWKIMWSMRVEIDDILAVVRPNATYTFASLTASKWTSTQSNANGAYGWTTSADYNNKTSSNVVIPFFAY